MTGVLLVDHGSRRKEANETIHHVVDLVRSVAPDWLVAAAHMELAEPSIMDGVRALYDLGVPHITVVPYMLTYGRHVREDIPRFVEQACAELGVTYGITAPLGSDPLLATLVKKRVDELFI